MCGWSRTGMAAIILDKWQISRNMMSVSWLLANRWLYSTQFCCISLLVEDLEFTRSSSVFAYMPLFLETCKRLIFSQQTNKLLCLANKNVHSSHTATEPMTATNTVVQRPLILFHLLCLCYSRMQPANNTTQYPSIASFSVWRGFLLLLLLCVSDANRPDWCIRNKRNEQQTTTHNRTWWERWYFTRLFSFSHYFVVVRCEMILVEEKSRYYSVHGSLINFNWWNWIGYTKPKTPAFFVVCVLCMCECVRSSSSLMKSRARDVCIVPNAVFPAYLASNINIHMRELLCVYTLPLCVVCMCWVCSTQYVWASSKPFPLLSMSALFFLFFFADHAVYSSPNGLSMYERENGRVTVDLFHGGWADAATSRIYICLFGDKHGETETVDGWIQIRIF